MSLKTSRLAFFAFFIEIVIIISICFTRELSVVSTLSFFQLLLVLTILVGKGYKLVSIPFFFTILLYIFHCSQFFINVFFIEYDKPVDVYKIVGEDNSIFLMKICMACFFCMSIGFFLSQNGKQVEIKKMVVPYSNGFLLFIGKLLIIVCIVPRIYVDLIRLIIFLRLGYMATYDVAASGIINTWAMGFYIGLYFLLLGNRNNPKKCNFILICTLVYAAFSMLSGRREVTICYLLVLLILYFNYVGEKNIDFKKILKFVFVGLLVVLLLASAGDLRMTRNASLADFGHIFIENLKMKMLLDQFGEFGGTSLTLSFIIQTVPELHNFDFGMTYIRDWILILPNVGQYLGEMMNNLSFVKVIPDEWQLYLGGSCIGELYYNFGYMAPLVFVFIGVMLTGISRKMDCDILNNKISIISIIIILIAPSLFLWIRGSFDYFIRPLVWYYILIKIINHLYRKKMNV